MAIKVGMKLNSIEEELNAKWQDAGLEISFDDDDKTKDEEKLDTKEDKN